MEVFKIKISPEVIRNELVSYTYSSNTFGYYSGLTNVLTAGTVNLGTYQLANPYTHGNLAPTLLPLDLNSTELLISNF